MVKDLVIFGTGDAAELAYWYFTRDSDRTVVAFTVDGAFLKEDKFLGLPVVPFENTPDSHPRETCDMFIALGYSSLNKLRKAKYLDAINAGYTLPSYISPRATILNDNAFGHNCFILENNVVQPHAKIGNNVTLWSGNHVGHHSSIADHCFLASHVVVSGRVSIGESCFLGVNATLRDNIIIGAECVIGANSMVLSDAENNGVYAARATERARVPSNRLRRI